MLEPGPDLIYGPRTVSRRPLELHELAPWVCAQCSDRGPTKVKADASPDFVRKPDGTGEANPIPSSLDTSKDATGTAAKSS